MLLNLLIGYHLGCMSGCAGSLWDFAPYQLKEGAQWFRAWVTIHVTQRDWTMWAVVHAFGLVSFFFNRGPMRVWGKSEQHPEEAYAAEAARHRAPLPARIVRHPLP